MSFVCYCQASHDDKFCQTIFASHHTAKIGILLRVMANCHFRDWNKCVGSVGTTTETTNRTFEAFCFKFRNYKSYFILQYMPHEYCHFMLHINSLTIQTQTNHYIHIILYNTSQSNVILTLSLTICMLCVFSCLILFGIRLGAIVHPTENWCEFSWPAISYGALAGIHKPTNQPTNQREKNI